MNLDDFDYRVDCDDFLLYELGRLIEEERASLEEKKETKTKFAGQLSDMAVVDLIQTIEISRTFLRRSSDER